MDDDEGWPAIEPPAPFLTGLHHERASIRLASLGASFDLPAGLHDRCLTPPPAANLDLATAAASSSLYWTHAKQRRAWDRCFRGRLMKRIVSEAFWWALARFFCVERDDDLLRCIEWRLAGQLVAVLEGVARPVRDLVADNLPDALAQSVFYMIHATQPHLRPHLDWQMGVTLTKEIAGWFHGPIEAPVDVRHWRLVRHPDRAPAPLVTDPIQDCLDALDDDGLRPSEKLDLLYRNRDRYVQSRIPIRTLQSLETFSNSKLVGQFGANVAPVKPFRVRMTRSGATRQPKTEAMFMRSLGLRRERDQNRQLRLKLDQLHAEVAKEIVDDDKTQQQMWRRLRRDRRQAKATSSEFVAGVVKQLHDDAGQGLGVSRLRIVSDAVRSEYGLGPAPCTDW